MNIKGKKLLVFYIEIKLKVVTNPPTTKLDSLHNPQHSQTKQLYQARESSLVPDCLFKAHFLHKM